MNKLKDKKAVFICQILLLFMLAKSFKCKECGTELASKGRLRKHQRFHKDAAWKEAGYVDPNNAIYPSMSNYTNSRLAFFLSHLLGNDEDSKKRKKAKQESENSQ